MYRRKTSRLVSVFVIAILLLIGSFSVVAQTNNPEAGKKKAAKRIGISSAVGAGAGALIGGKKGALIGAGAGAGAGTAYHYHKKNKWKKHHRRHR